MLHFDREVELLQDLTSSRKELEDALRDLDGGQPRLNRRGSGGNKRRPTEAVSKVEASRERGGGGTALYGHGRRRPAS